VLPTWFIFPPLPRSTQPAIQKKSDQAPILSPVPHDAPKIR
jgi:hypothetical protein